MSKQDEHETFKNVKSYDVPFSALGNGAHIEMFGNSRLALEGIFSIIEYTDTLIKIKLKKSIIQIFGANLIINNVNNENLLITGKIISLEFTK